MELQKLQGGSQGSWPGVPSLPVQTCSALADAAPLPIPTSCFQAQAVTLTVAQAFKVAFEFWQVSKEGETLHLHCGCGGRWGDT